MIFTVSMDRLKGGCWEKPGRMPRRQEAGEAKKPEREASKPKRSEKPRIRKAREAKKPESPKAGKPGSKEAKKPRSRKAKKPKSKIPPSNNKINTLPLAAVGMLFTGLKTAKAKRNATYCSRAGEPRGPSSEIQNATFLSLSTSQINPEGTQPPVNPPSVSLPHVSGNLRVTRRSCHSHEDALRLHVCLALGRELAGAERHFFRPPPFAFRLRAAGLSNVWSWRLRDIG